jgi:hypothetical protein
MARARKSDEIGEEQSTQEQIEQQAYVICLKHNGEEGHALEDWLAAEEEVRQARSKNNTAPLRTKAAVAGQQRTR